MSAPIATTPFGPSTSASFHSSTLPYLSNGLGYTLHLPQQTRTANSKKLPLLILCHPFNNSRHYWAPQLSDPRLKDYPKLCIDALGFAESRVYNTRDGEWNFDEYAQGIFDMLDRLDGEVGEGRKLDVGFQAVLIGDSMGGGPTGLRVGLLDNHRVTMQGKRRIVVGIVAVGTSAEIEREDFVSQYTISAKEFTSQCLSPTIGPLLAIKTLATNMSTSGYGPLASSSTLSFGTKVIEDSLKITLCNQEGVLEPVEAGRRMEMNYKCLNYRRGLVELLERRPSGMGKCQVLVLHGAEDEAYPLSHENHTTSHRAIGEANSELQIIEGGPHFLTVTHWDEVGRRVLDWIERKCVFEV